MSGWRLFGWIFGRILVSGIILGVAFTLAFVLTSPSSFHEPIGAFIRDLFFIILFAAFFGAFLGFVDGIINGIVLVIHAACFQPDRRTSRLYRWSAFILALVCTASATYFMMRDLLHFYGIVSEVTVIASLAAAYFAWRLVDANAPKSSSTPPANAVLFYIEK